MLATSSPIPTEYIKYENRATPPKVSKTPAIFSSTVFRCEGVVGIGAAAVEGIFHANGGIAFASRLD